MTLRIVIGSDHLGWIHKEEIKNSLIDLGFEVEDFGCSNSIDMVNYNTYAEAVAGAVSSGKADRGILICGSGHGMAMVANRYPGVRAANCHNIASAQLSRNHTDANVLCLGAEFVAIPDALVVAAYWCQFAFEGGRHAGRLERIARLETVA